MIPTSAAFGIGECIGVLFLAGLLSFDWFIKDRIWKKPVKSE